MTQPARTGLLHCPAFAPWIEQNPEAVECLEVQGCRLYASNARLVNAICGLRPTLISRGWLSLGTPGPLPADRVRSFAAIVKRVDPPWISEPLGFCRTDEWSWESYLPLCFSGTSLNVVVDHAVEVMDVCQKPLLLETIASSIQPHAPMRETDFLNQVCEKARCGLLLDVTALWVNALNQRFDPVQWIHRIDPRFIAQIHVSGYSCRDGRSFDEHSSAVQDEVWELAGEVLRVSAPQAIVIEHDANYPPVFTIEQEIARSKEMILRMPAETRG